MVLRRCDLKYHINSWWWQLKYFIFILTRGNDPFWRAYFSNGLLQPPTRIDRTVVWAVFFWKERNVCKKTRVKSLILASLRSGCRVGFRREALKMVGFTPVGVTCRTNCKNNSWKHLKKTHRKLAQMLLRSSEIGYSVKFLKILSEVFHWMGVPYFDVHGMMCLNNMGIPSSALGWPGFLIDLAADRDPVTPYPRKTKGKPDFFWWKNELCWFIEMKGSEKGEKNTQVIETDDFFQGHSGF